MNEIKIISIVVAIIVFAIILLVGLKTNLLRETNKVSNPYSFSRTQLWLWMLVICPVIVLFWGFNFNVDFKLTINSTSLVLLGIPSAVALLAGVVTYEQSKGKKILKKNNESKSFISDILADDSGQFSLVRLQQAIFTIIFIAIYISVFVNSGLKEYPDFEGNSYLLMGISSGTYLIGKGINK